MTTNTWVFLFHCPLCGESIVLPRQSLLGKYEGQQFLTTPMWPITFLCRGHGQVCECSIDRIDLEPAQRPTQPLQSETLWEIEVGCAHEGCRLLHAIYAKYQPDRIAQDVIENVLITSPRIPCTGDHDVVFQREKMRVRAFEY
jgi:hypothetical protein